MPRSRDGPSANAATAVSTGASSPTSPRSRSTPSTRSGPVTVSPSSSRRTWAPNRGQDAGAARRPPASCAPASPATVTTPPVTTAAARKAAALDRSGSITRRRMWSGPGSTRQVTAVHVLDDRAGRAQHLHGHVDVRPRRQRAAGVADLAGVGEARRGEQQRADELRRHRGVDGDAAARAPSRGRARSAAAGRAGPRRRPRATAGRARRAPTVARASAGRRRTGRRPRPERRRAAGSASPCRRCPRPPRPARAAGRAPPASRRPASSTPGAHGAQPGGHQRRCRGCAAGTQAAGAAAERRQDQRAVGLRLRAGQPHGGPYRIVGDGGRPRLGHGRERSGVVPRRGSGDRQPGSLRPAARRVRRVPAAA